jgi:hypothetical protein
MEELGEKPTALISHGKWSGDSGLEYSKSLIIPAGGPESAIELGCWHPQMTD